MGLPHNSKVRGLMETKPFTPTECPDHDDLVAVARGDVENGALTAHVESCNACRAYLDALPDKRDLLPEETEQREPNMAVFNAVYSDRKPGTES
jgi:hypothetical protein